MKLKNNKGITGIDISVSLVIIVLFVGIVSSLLYNFVISSKDIDRKGTATDIAIQVIENIKQMEYEDIKEDSNGGITPDYINTYFKAKTGNQENKIEIKPGYDIKINIENYKEKTNDNSLQDVLKIVKVTVNYSIGKRQQSIDISTTITKED